MSSVASGLQLDQAPPLSVPAAFFCCAPVAVVAAGGLLIWRADDVLLSAWRPVTVALTHLGSLGLLGVVMLGALYQMVPVVAGRPVPLARLAHGVLLPFVIGLACLVAGFAAAMPALLHLAVLGLGLSLGVFLLQVGVALLRPGAHDASVTGMRLALSSLLGVLVIGLTLAHGHATGMLPSTRVALLQLHIGFGLLGWVGGLMSAISWKVLPMFYLAPELPARARHLVLALILAGLLLPLVAVGVGQHSTTLLALLAAPAAVAVWLIQPALLLRSLARRRRRRTDASLNAWQAGLVLAPLTALLAAATVWLPDLRWALAFGWLAIWGQAGLVLHGMLTRILPFLVWYHRFSARVGHSWVPTMRELLPDRVARAGLGLHGITLIFGLVAIASGSAVATTATGVALVVTGLALGRTVAHVLRRSATPAAVAEAASPRELPR